MARVAVVGAFHWPRPRTPQAVQPHSMLAPVRTVLLGEAPDVYGTDEVERHLTAWLAARPDFSPGHDGPTREQWEALVSG
ncbi:hypothetical protein LUX12_00680 [Streptomyces somaliensis]|uniref:hypothetical protein n=1 Tax=Streptomyces somaliensis TaxID=78355 RepID=UPI0020CE8EAC|nr:hypothetical protein [Streptomyces somaliensis]MCP9943649.1 hypothetical protein [Streptomyces somaliensis]MCP9963103.1 hypothetical protein [Streptomyces somaliensis]MCP9975954.1 hypothetical protein [Streptomyces somaliensis]